MNSNELKGALKEMGWSQKRLADVVDMHQNSISKMIAKDKINGAVAALVDTSLALHRIATMHSKAK